MTVTDASGNSSSCNATITITAAPGVCPIAKNQPQANPGNAAGASSGNAETARMTAFPNPFTDVTTLRFSLGEAQGAVLKVFSITGVEIATLFEGQAEGGMEYNFEFRPEAVSSGMYFAKLVTSTGEVKYEKLIMQK